AQETIAKSAVIMVEGAAGSLSNDTAAPLALILNELLTNAVKHGLKGEEGVIRVGIAHHADQFTLYVEDEGEGFDFAAGGRRSSGPSLVQALARQLKGRLEVTRSPTRCSLVFREPGEIHG